MGILIPWVAKHLLRAVLSTTPGNFFAEYTVKTSEKQEARTGALPVLIAPDWVRDAAVSESGVPEPVGAPTFTNEKRRLKESQYIDIGLWVTQGAYRKQPSVRTERSCRTNQIPILSSGSVNLKAEAAKLPIRFRVNMPPGCV